MDSRRVALQGDVISSSHISKLFGVWHSEEDAHGTHDAQREQLLTPELAARMDAGPEGRSVGAWLRTACCVLASAACYYVATQIAWVLCFPDSKVSLFFPPHAVLIVHSAARPHPALVGLCARGRGRPFPGDPAGALADGVRLALRGVRRRAECVAAAAGIRFLIRSPLKAITLRDAIVFVLVAVVLVPFGTAFWGASFTVSYGFGTRYWIEWRNLGISNAVTAVVLVPAFLLGAHHLFVRRPRALSRATRCWKRLLVGACTVALGIFVFDQMPAGPDTSPRSAVRADSAAHLGGAPLRPWGHQRLDVDHHVPGDLGNHARARPVPGPDSRRERAGAAVVPPGDGHSADAAGGRDRRGTALEGSVA